MKMTSFLTVFLLASLSWCCAEQEFPIKNFVVIMFENRSFDHMLGWLHSTNNTDITGLTGNEFNLVNSGDPASPKVFVSKDGYNVGPDDPNHDFDSTTEQIFGTKSPPAGAQEAMNGFVQNAHASGLNTSNIMAMFTVESAPILNTLALEYAVFSEWFCSLPGPTDPNRAFFMSGTSRGVVHNFDGTLWPQQSYFDFLREHNVTWAAHYQDDPWAIMYFADTHKPENSQHISTLDAFFNKARAGTLPQFTLLQPRMTSSKGPPTWQHPDASVREGERLMKQIYEAMRASPQWETSALLITYDEHGGFFDHVTPPSSGVPNPDTDLSPPAGAFQFDRLGIRIPTVLISPWVKRGTVVHRPHGPHATSQFDATSTMSTVNALFGITDSMSARAAWAGTFHHLFQEMKEPRTDCPATLPDLPPWTMDDLRRQRALPLNDHMKIQVEFYCQHNHQRTGCVDDIRTQGEASAWLDREIEAFMGRVQGEGRSVLSGQ